MFALILYILIFEQRHTLTSKGNLLEKVQIHPDIYLIYINIVICS